MDGDSSARRGRALALSARHLCGALALPIHAPGPTAFGDWARYELDCRDDDSPEGMVANDVLQTVLARLNRTRKEAKHGIDAAASCDALRARGLGPIGRRDLARSICALENHIPVAAGAGMLLAARLDVPKAATAEDSSRSPGPAPAAGEAPGAPAGAGKRHFPHAVAAIPAGGMPLCSLSQRALLRMAQCAWAEDATPWPSLATPSVPKERGPRPWSPAHEVAAAVATLASAHALAAGQFAHAGARLSTQGVRAATGHYRRAAALWMWLDQQALPLLRQEGEGPSEAPPLARALASAALGLALFLELARALLDAVSPAALLPYARKALLRFRRAAAELKVARPHASSPSALAALRPRLQEWVRALRAHARALSHCLLAERLREQGDEAGALKTLARAAWAARAAADGASACSRFQPAPPPLCVLGMRAAAPDRGRSAGRVRTGPCTSAAPGVASRPATAGTAASPSSRWVLEAEAGVEALRGAVRAAVQGAREAGGSTDPGAFLASTGDADPDFAALYGPDADVAAGEAGGDEDAMVGAGVPPEGLVSLCGPEGDPRFSVGPTTTTWSTTSADDLGYGWSLLLVAAWEQELALLLTVTAAAATAEAAVRLGLVARQVDTEGKGRGREGAGPGAAGARPLEAYTAAAAARLSSALLGAVRGWGLGEALPDASATAVRVLRRGTRDAGQCGVPGVDAEHMAPLTGVWPGTQPSLAALCESVERDVGAGGESGGTTALRKTVPLVLEDQRAAVVLRSLLRGHGHAPRAPAAPCPALGPGQDVLQPPVEPCEGPAADGGGDTPPAPDPLPIPSGHAADAARPSPAGLRAPASRAVQCAAAVGAAESSLTPVTPEGGGVRTGSQQGGQRCAGGRSSVRERGAGGARGASLRRAGGRPLSAAPPSRRRRSGSGQASSRARQGTRPRHRVQSATGAGRPLPAPAARTVRCALCEAQWRPEALVRAVPMGLVERMRQRLGARRGRAHSPPALAHTDGHLCAFCAQFFDPGLPESMQRPSCDPGSCTALLPAGGGAGRSAVDTAAAPASGARERVWAARQVLAQTQLVNLAAGQPCEMSSKASPAGSGWGSAACVVSGQVAPRGPGGCAQTQEEDEPWWEVEWGEKRSAVRVLVRLVGREPLPVPIAPAPPPGASRLPEGTPAQTWLLLCPEALGGMGLEAAIAQACARKCVPFGETEVEWSLPAPVQASALRVQAAGIARLQLGYVEVTGLPRPDELRSSPRTPTPAPVPAPSRLRARPSTASPRPAGRSPQRRPAPRGPGSNTPPRRGSTGRDLRRAESAMPQATAVIRASDGARSAVESSASEGEATDASEAGPSAQRGRDSGRLLRRGLAPPAHGPICRGPQRLPAGHDSPLLATELIRSRSRTAMPASRQASVQSSVHEPSMAVDAAPTSGLGRVPWKRPQPSTGLPRSPGVPHRVPLPPGLPASYLSQGSACAMARVARSPGSAGARRRSAPAPAPAPRVAVQPGTALPLPRGHTPRAQAVGLMLRRAACGYTRGLSQGQWGAEVLADAFAVLPSGDDALVLARLFHRILTRPGAGAGAWRAAAIAFATAPDPAGVDRGKEGDDEWMQPLEQSEAVALVESLAPEPGNAVPAAAVAAALLEPALAQARCRPSESAVLAALEGAEASEGVSPTPGALARLAVARLVHDAGAAHHLLQLLLRGPALLSWPALATLAALSAAAPPSPPVPPATPVPSLHGDGAQRPAATPRAHTADSSCVGASSSEHAVVGAPNSAPQGEEEEEAEAEAGSGRTAAQDPCLARLRAAWRRLCTGEGRGAGRMPSPASSAARGPGRSATSSYSTRRRSRPATVSRLSGSTGQGPAGAARTGSASGSTTLRRIRSAQRTARAARAVGLASASVASTFRDMTAQDSGAAARRSPPRTRPVAQRVAEERAGRSGGGGGGGVATPLCRRRRTSASATRAPRRSPSRASVGRGGALRGRDRAHTPGQAGAAQRLERARPQSAASARPSVPTALSEALCGAGGQGRERAPGGPRSASPTAQRGPPAKGGGEEGGGGGGSDPWPLSSSSRLARGKLRLPTQRCALCEYPFPRGAMYGQTLLSAVLRVRTEWGYPCDVAVPPWASCSVLPLCAMCTAIRDGALKREEARQRAARAQEASRRRVLKARLEARRRRMLEALDQDQGGPLSAQADAARTRPSPMRSPAQSVGPEPAVDDSSDPCGGGGSAGEVTLPEPRGSGALELPQPEQERDGCGGGEPCREAECCAKSTGEGVGGYDLEAIPHSQQGGATPEVAALRPRQEPVSPPSISQATWHDGVSESSVQVPRDMALGVDVPRAEACLQSAEPVVDDDLRHELQAFRVSLLDKKDRLLQRRAALQRKKAQLIRARIQRTGAPLDESDGAAHCR